MYHTQQCGRLPSDIAWGRGYRVGFIYLLLEEKCRGWEFAQTTRIANNLSTDRLDRTCHLMSGVVGA